MKYMSRRLAVLSENRESKYFGDSSDFGELSFSIEISPTTGSDALAQRISALGLLNLILRFAVPWKWDTWGMFSCLGCRGLLSASEVLAIIGRMSGVADNEVSSSLIISSFSISAK